MATKKRPAVKKHSKAKKAASKTGGKGTTLVAFILDETGSMMACRTDAIGGFNQYIEQVGRDKKNKYIFRLTRFNSTIGTRDSAPCGIKEVEPLSMTNFVPFGTTPLYDAIGKTIAAVDAMSHPGNILVIILTDGEENSSVEHTKHGIKHLIEEKTREGWNFMYLGANQDAWSEAGRIGIGAASTMSYDAKDIGSAYSICGQSTVYTASVTGGMRGHVANGTMGESADWKKARKQYKKR